MCFDLDHGRLDSRRFVNGQQPVQSDVRQSDGPAFATIHETLHRPPGHEQSHAAVVKDIAVLIARILLVARLKRKWGVTEIEIQIVESKSVPTRLESWFDALRPMTGVPQLCGNENVFTGNPSSGESCLQRLAHLTLVPISFRTLEVSKSSFQRVSDSAYRRRCIGNQGAKAEYGHMAGSVAERHSFSPKIRRVDHDDTSVTMVSPCKSNVAQRAGGSVTFSATYSTMEILPEFSRR
jgi:hypothetical protein